jgi:hypothetical protein
MKEMTTETKKEETMRYGFLWNDQKLMLFAI